MSETDFLKLKKHDNPETNTEKFDIENYLNGNWDKINENAKKVNTDISNIQAEQETQNTNIEENNSKIIELQNEKAELEKELKEAQEDFYQNSIRGQASGEYIHVEDSSNCRAKIGIGGNHEQKMRSGKNLLLNDTDKGTVNGITFTKDSKGIIKANGTATDAIVVYLGSKFTTIAAGTYKLSDGRNDESKDTFFTYVDCYNTDGSAYATGNLISTSDGSVKTYTEPKLIKGRIVVRKGVTLNNIVFKPQLELIKNASDSATEYEQYGASPSPEYSSEVKTVGNNINLLPSDLFSSTALNGINYTNKDGIITVNGTATENSFYTKTITLKAGTYTLNGAPKGSAQDKYCLQAQGLGAGDFGSGQTFTIDTEKQVTLRIMVWKGITVNNIIFKPKLIKGTEVGEYSKFGQGCVKVTKCNKNLFDKDNITLSEKSYNLDDNGELIFQGSWRVVNYIKVKPNTTYTLSGVMIPNKWTHRISEYDAQLVHTKQNQKTFDGFHTFTTSSTTKYIRFNLISGNNGFDYDLSSIQLEENKEKTTLEQHEEQSYIMPTQTEMLENDYLDYDNEEEVHVWGKKILDGTEEINLQWDASDKHGYRIAIDNIKKTTSSSEKSLVISNSYKAYKQDDLFNLKYKAYGISNRYNNSEVIIRNDDITTVADFKANLKSQYDAKTPVIVYYKQQTPTRLPFTDEQKAVAEELNNARTYKNVTNITTDSKAILSLDYAKDLETLLTSKESEV